MRIPLFDRIISILAYFTFGIFSLIWIIYANLTKKRIDSFLGFNLYQAILLSVILCVFGYLYAIAINLMSAIPFVGNFAKAFDLFFCQTPLYFGFTLSGFLLTLFVFYLSFIVFLGKKPYIPVISDIVKDNFGG